MAAARAGDGVLGVVARLGALRAIDASAAANLLSRSGYGGRSRSPGWRSSALGLQPTGRGAWHADIGRGSATVPWRTAESVRLGRRRGPIPGLALWHDGGCRRPGRAQSGRRRAGGRVRQGGGPEAARRVRRASQGDVISTPAMASRQKVAVLGARAPWVTASRRCARPRGSPSTWTTPGGLRKGIEGVRDSLDRVVAKARLTAAQRTTRRSAASARGGDLGAAVEGADVVIEAVPRACRSF